MTFIYGKNMTTMQTDDGSIQLVFMVDPKDSLRFKTAMHTSEGLQVENFNVKLLRIFVRKGDNGVRIIQEDHPTQWKGGW